MEDYIINFNGELYYIIYKDNKLILSSNRIKKIIGENIIKYSIQYYDEYIYIIYLKEKSSIYICKFNIANNSSEEDKITINNIKEILLINLEIILNEFHIIFIATNNDSLRIFDLVINKECHLNKIEDVKCPRYVQSISSILVNHSILFLLCTNYEQSLYSIYIYNNGVYNNIGSFILKDALNVLMLKVKEDICIFYNRAKDKKMMLLCRKINISSDTNKLSNESIILNECSLSKPRISYFDNKLFVMFRNSNIENIFSFKEEKSTNHIFIYKNERKAIKVINIKGKIVNILNCYGKIIDEEKLVENKVIENKVIKKNSIQIKNTIKNYNNIAIEYKFLIKSYLNEEKIKEIEKNKYKTTREFKDKINKIQLEKSRVLIRDMNVITYLIKVIEEKDKIIKELLRK